MLGRSGSAYGALLRIVGTFLGRFGFNMVEVKIGDLAAGQVTRKRVTLRRTETDHFGTFGVLTTPSGLQLYSGELPWKKNAKNKSCIPAGTYNCVWTTTPQRPEGVYEVKDVEGRTAILIHVANWMGDPDRNLKTNVTGCIGLGRAIGEIGGQKALLRSYDAINSLVADLEKEPFVLVIEWGPQVSREACS